MVFLLADETCAVGAFFWFWFCFVWGFLVLFLGRKWALWNFVAGTRRSVGGVKFELFAVFSVARVLVR